MYGLHDGSWSLATQTRGWPMAFALLRVGSDGWPG